MKLLRTLLILLILIAPATTYAVPTSWDYTGTVLRPLQSMWTKEVQVPYVTATSTATSTFPSLSVTTSFDFLGTIITNVSTWFNNLFDTQLATKDTGDLTEGSNLYYTDERSEDATGAMFSGNTETLITATYQDADGTVDLVVDNDLANYSNTNTAFIDLTDLSSSATGLSYNNGTGAFTLTSGYTIPLNASTTEWATAFGWGNHASQGYLTSVAPTDLNSADFGDFTCNGTSCALDTGTVSDNEIDYTNVTLNDLTFDVNSVSKTEFGYLNGVTSAIQTQLGTKLENITGESLEDLGDVGTFTQSSGDLLYWDGDSWENIATSSLGIIASSESGTSSVAFFARKTTDQTIATNTVTVINWETEDYDTNTNFDLSTDVFTPTVAGVYQLNLNVWCQDSTAQCVTYIYKNGSAVAASFLDSPDNDTGSVISTMVQMNGTTDYVDARVRNSAGDEIDGNVGYYTTFSGALVAPVFPSGGGWSNDGTQSYVADVADKVAIGTTTASETLTIVGDQSVSATSTVGNLVIGSLSGFLKATAGVVATALIDLASDVTGTLPVANGGTGATTLNNLITLATHTTGNFVATIADAGNSTITVSNSGSENAGVTLDVVDVNCTDCLGTTEIADSYLLNSGDVGTGSYDFGGASFLEIPNGANPTANDAGELAHDTTDNQLILDDYIIRTSEKILAFTLASTSPEFVSGGEIPLPLEKDGYTVTNIKCYVQGGTSVQATLTDNTNAMDTLTCATTATTDDGTIANSTVTANELMYVDIGTISGTPDYLTFSVFGRWSRE